MPSKLLTRVRAGDRLIVETAGGGGYGDPRQRDREAVREDGARKPPRMAVKCDLCAGRADMACISNCPCGAIERIDPDILLGST